MRNGRVCVPTERVHAAHPQQAHFGTRTDGQNLDRINSSLSLEGLGASHEWTLSREQHDIKHRFQRKRIEVAFSAQLAKQRGLYFVDVLSNGVHARCVIKIGDGGQTAAKHADYDGACLTQQHKPSVVSCAMVVLYNCVY